MDCDSFVLSFETQNLNKNPTELEYFFDFCSLDENHELFSNHSKKTCR